MKRSIIVLAIAPGKREIGIAVFRGFELYHFSTTEIKKGISEQRLKIECTNLSRSLFIEFKPKVLVLRAVSGYQKGSLRLKHFLNEFKVQAARLGIPPVEVTLSEVRTMLSSNGKPTQKNAFRNLGEMYPGLRQYFDRPSAWQNQYYKVLLSAVAIGVVYLKLQSAS